MADWTQKQMDAVEARYKDDCHERAIHRPQAWKHLLEQKERAIAEFERRRKGLAPSTTDLWTELSKFKQRQTSGVTGPLIRKALRSFLEKEQNHLCCYCQRPLVNIAHAKPIEHILPRVDFVQYSFHFWNLAVACFDCNQIKSDAVWADEKKQGQAAYPQPGAFTEMYHPRFHTFAEHVRFIRVQTNEHLISLYVGISEQGRHLCLNLLKELSAREIVLNSNPRLKQAQDVINGHVAAQEGDLPPALKAFSDALSTSTKALIDSHCR
ncbi:hypothetical protein K8374_10655 [Pseudomonas sp. p1(2021b)]|uniref:HNH endonuclease n=1 Tax=Pseudomonas sp. p1(2021b) TaxID=2874628 RepID=UPI001CCB3DAD|nr:HNH endonuclease domain-containing protein [Pseudomonas sp. p1(2021b)]UBM27377.1 hypothetical protein K8374_10655 [Pseudomonas sp. p1(2021b)]